MKYPVTHLPNTAHALRFKITNEKADKHSEFAIDRKLNDVWGKPAVAKLKEVMVAYVKRHGWPKDPVTLDLKNSPRSLNGYTAFLAKSK